MPTKLIRDIEIKLGDNTSFLKEDKLEGQKEFIKSLGIGVISEKGVNELKMSFPMWRIIHVYPSEGRVEYDLEKLEEEHRPSRAGFKVTDYNDRGNKLSIENYRFFTYPREK